MSMLTVKLIPSAGNSCNFCNKPNDQKVVLEVKSDGISVRFCTSCFLIMQSQGNKEIKR